MIASPGDLIDNRYRIERLIGKGGMGKVYLAFDLRLEKNWAVKELTSRESHGIGERDILKKLKHPALPGIVDIIEEKDKTFLVMDFISGITLEEVCAFQRKLPERAVLQWGLEICNVLEYLHRQKPPIIYRDLKPSNLMVDKRGRIYLVDFGIALIKTGFEAEERRGTKGYAAPEQYLGMSGVQSDIYGLGMVLRYLMKYSGEKGGNRETIKRITEKCTRRERGERYRNIREVKKDLSRLLYRKRQMGAVTGIGLSLVIAGGVMLTQQQIDARKQEILYKESLETGALQEENARKAYEKAIELKPEKESVYLALLNTYISQGETEKGIRRVQELIEMHKKDLPSEHRLWMELGRIYFRGSIRDSYFAPNYKKAGECFDMAEEHSEEKKCYQNLCRIFSAYSDEVLWEEASCSLEELETLLKKEGTPMEYAGGCLALCSLYFSYEEELKAYNKDPMETGINLAKRGLSALEKCRDHILYPVYAQECCLFLGKAYEILEDWEKAIAQYEKAMEFPAAKEEQVRICLMEAWDYRMNGSCEKAEECYEELIQRFPEEAEPYCAYSLMALMEEKDPDKAEKIVKRGQKAKGLRENYNYKILTERLEELKRGKGTEE